MAINWYQNSIIYGIAVDRFQDTNGDGIGDLEGIRRQLPYLADLGVECVWLLPFYRSPMRDDGYDVADHMSVDHRYGTIGDLRQLVRDAGALGMRVVADLVVNHTSIDHQWFQKARRDLSSRFRDYYVWVDDPADGPSPQPTMPPVQREVWTYDDLADAYYLHHFFSHEPDLNTANRDVFRELTDTVAFLLDQGIEGFRLDAAPYAVAKAGGVGDDGAFDPDAGHWYLTELRTFIDTRTSRTTFLFAEANIAPQAQRTFFGEDEEEVHGLYNFTANQFLFLALADRSALPLRRALVALPERPPWAVLVNWVRNLDELDLKQLDDDERRRVEERFSPHDDTHAFDGLVRRAPALLGDDALLRLAYVAAFTLPGIPMLSYGEEIALGDDLSQDGRQVVRPPMQWNDAPNAGFCAAGVEPDQPLVGDRGRPGTNVAAQMADPDSMLRWMRRLIRARRTSPAIGGGTLHVDDEVGDHVLAMTYALDHQCVVVLLNFGTERTSVDAALVDRMTHRREVLADRPYAPSDGGDHRLPIDALGYRWFVGEPG